MHGKDSLITPDGILTPLASGFVEKLAEYCDEARAFQPQIVAKYSLSEKLTTDPLAEFFGKIAKIEQDQRISLPLNFSETENARPS